MFEHLVYNLIKRNPDICNLSIKFKKTQVIYILMQSSRHTVVKCFGKSMGVTNKNIMSPARIKLKRHKDAKKWWHWQRTPRDVGAYKASSLFQNKTTHLEFQNIENSTIVIYNLR